ncbi:MAG TPA: hypothetical protein DEB22_09555, partial [Alcanivorax sp.]|nr:hypothetical protein [Alcanivorax sp.]
DRIEVAEGWENAVEAVLGDALQAVSVDGLEEVSSWLGDLTHGRVALVHESPVQASGDAGDLLRSHVTGQVP